MAGFSLGARFHLRGNAAHDAVFDFARDVGSRDGVFPQREFPSESEELERNPEPTIGVLEGHYFTLDSSRRISAWTSRETRSLARYTCAVLMCNVFVTSRTGHSLIT